MSAPEPIAYLLTETLTMFGEATADDHRIIEAQDAYIRKDGLPREMAEYIKSIQPYVPQHGWDDPAEALLSRWDELDKACGR